MLFDGFAINADAGTFDGSLGLLREELRFYAGLGFSHVEISPHGVGAMINGRLREAKMLEVLSLLSDNPFAWVVHGPNPLNLMDRRDPDFAAEMFRASLEFTALVGANIMVYHAGRFLPEEEFLLPAQRPISASEKEEMWAQECTLLRRMGDIASSLGVVIAVENARPYPDASPYCYGEFLETLAAMIREVDHPNVGVTLDFGHAYLAACYHDYDLLAGVTALAPHIRHIHLHDNFGKASASYERKQWELAATGRGDMHLPIGWGEIPAAAMLARLPDYRGVITLEMRARYRDHYGEALENARQLLIGRQSDCQKG